MAHITRLAFWRHLRAEPNQYIEAERQKFDAEAQAEREQIAAQGQAQAMLIEAQAKAEARRQLLEVETDAEARRVELWRDAPPAVALGLAAQSFADKVRTIQHLNLTPNLLNDLL